MRDVTAIVSGRGWENIQSRWVLPTARRLYLIGALGALLIATIALVVALLFQFGTLGGASMTPVPDVVSTQPKDISAGDLDSLFSGPQGLRAEANPLVAPIEAGAEVAKLGADTVFGIAEFQLIGGNSVELVTDGYGPADDSNGANDRLVKGAVLRATADLAKQLNALHDAGKPAPVLRLRLLAKDRNGNLSAPSDVAIQLAFRPEEKASTNATAPDTDTREDVSGPVALRGVAANLASIVSSAQGSPEWIDAYKVAMGEPDRCDANNDRFIGQYKAAFRRLRAKLTASNLDTFYRGLCDAWTSAAAGAQADASAANAKRQEIIVQNLANEATTALRKTAARTVRDAALGVALSAIFFFMIIALFLAFLAIEGHSHAVREALQKIAGSDE